MTATGHMRGHRVHWDGTTWRYDDGTEATTERPCVSCGATAAPDGPDPCLGVLPGVSSACCGHGVEAPYVVTARFPGEAAVWPLAPNRGLTGPEGLHRCNSRTGGAGS